MKKIEENLRAAMRRYADRIQPDPAAWNRIRRELGAPRRSDLHRLAIAMLAVTAIATLVAVRLGGDESRGNLDVTTPTPVQTLPTLPPPSSSASPAPSARPGYAAMFLDEDVVKMDEDDFSGFIGVFLASLPDGGQTAVRMEEPSRLYVSLDGKLLAHLRFAHPRSTLSLAQNGEFRFRELVGSDQAILSAAWTPDSKRLVYFTAPWSPEGDDPSGSERLRIIDVDTGEDRIVATFAKEGGYRYRTLLGLDPTGRNVFWIKQTWEGAGGAEDLTMTSLETGESRLVGENTRHTYAYAMSPGMEKLFYVRDAGILIERTLSNQEERILYEVDRSTECGVENPIVDPSGTRLLFLVTTEPVVETACATGPEGFRATTYLLDLVTLKRTTIRSEEDRLRGGLDPVSWSPDGEYAWLRRLRAIEILDVSANRFIDLTPPDGDLSRQFLVWIPLDS